jgi:hypothetical protein
MSENPLEEVLEDLFRYLELLETQSGAVLQYLKDKGIASDEHLAPYLEQAANASNVKWRAARVRMRHLFAVAPQPAGNEVSKPENKEVKKEATKTDTVTSQQKAMPHQHGDSSNSTKLPEADSSGTDPRAKEVAARSEAGEKSNSSQENANRASETSPVNLPITKRPTSEGDSASDETAESSVPGKQEAA